MYGSIRNEKSQMWELLRSEVCNGSFTADTCNNFSLRRVVLNTKKNKIREPGLFKEEFLFSAMLSFCSKKYCCYDSLSNKLKFSSKVLNRRTFEDSRNRPLATYRKMLDETEYVTFTNRGFRTKNQCVLCSNQRTDKEETIFILS